MHDVIVEVAVQELEPAPGVRDHIPAQDPIRGIEGNHSDVTAVQVVKQDFSGAATMYIACLQGWAYWSSSVT